jgi:serine/threonine-protein kinase
LRIASGESMPTVVTCPRGHQWASDASPQANADGETICPVCGSEVTIASKAAAGDIQSSLTSVKPVAADVVAPSLPATVELTQALSTDAIAGAGQGGRPLEAPDPTIDLPAYSSEGDAQAATAEFVSDSANEANEPSAWALAGPPGMVDRTTPVSTTRKQTPKQVAGYEILGELGRGGMGVVYKARHVSLNRIVALKMILAGGHAGQHELARFRAEAEAVAHLQHPNIVQVYDVGEADGCPYLSLEFVDGISLSDQSAGAPQSPPYAAECVRALAEAMDYAHRRGILHRDLKPANILLATSGSAKPGFPSPAGVAEAPAADLAHSIPKITDFGLAKRLEEDSSQTRSGTILGTPSYMAPEQASGLSKGVGPAADIYSLGAILYELLTGRPPFRGETMLDTMHMVRNAEAVPPSRLQPKVPRDLETICLKCLEKEPVKRYRSSALLAEDLHRFLSHTPILARPAPVWERTWKWARRRPAVAALVAVSTLGVLSLILGGFAFARQEARRADEASRLQQLAVEERERAQQQERLAQEQARIAKEKQHEAEQEHDRAEQNFAKALEAVDQMLTRVGQERLAKEPRMERVRRDLLQKALAFYQGFLQSQKDDPALRAETAKAHWRVGTIQEQLGDYAAAEHSYRSAIGLFKDLAAARADRPDYAEQLAQVTDQLAVVVQATGRRAEAETLNQQALDLDSRLASEHPQIARYRRQLASAYHNQGLFQQTSNHLTEADQSYRRAQDLWTGLVSQYPQTDDYRQELARTCSNRGALMHMTGQSKEAESLYRQAIDIQRELVNESDDNPNYQAELGRAYRNLAVLLQLNQRWQEAEQAYRQASRTFASLAERFPSVPDHRHELAGNSTNLSQLLQATNHQAQALQEAQKAIDLLSRLVQETQDTPIYRQELARALDRQAVLLASTRRPIDAEKTWRRAIELQEALAAQFPSEPVYRQELAHSHGNLAILFAQLSRSQPAEEQNHAAIALLKELVDDYPAQSAYRQELLLYHKNLASLLTALDRKQDAEKIWREILSLQEKQLQVAQGTASTAQQAALESALGDTLHQLAQLQIERRQLKEAQRWLRQALDHQRAAVAANPSQASYRLDLCNYDLALLDVLVRLGRHAEADRTAVDLQTAAPADWPGLIKAAGLVAKCVPLSESDTSFSPADRKEQGRTYTLRAVQLLKEAIAGGYRDTDSLRSDAAFEPIRSSTDFQKLLASVESKPSAK